MLRFTPFGGASEIGASCYAVEAFGMLVVVDAGMRPKATGEERYPDFEALADLGQPSACLVTHGHVDHVGGLPLFMRRFPDTPVYGTVATARIADTILRDSVSLMQKDADFDGAVDYTLADVEGLLRAWRGVSFHTPTVIAATPEVTVLATFIPSGHILGAAMIVLEFEEAETGRREVAFMGGDVSDFRQPTIPGADHEAVRGLKPGLMVCEGTYGTETHRDMDLEAANFVRRVAEIVRDGGSVIIPAFAVGRAQNISLLLRDALRSPERFRRILRDDSFEMPDVPVYLDGLCRTVADIYASFPELLSPGAAGDGGHPFYGGGHVQAVAGRHEREAICAAIREGDMPCVIISSSGMLATGSPSFQYALAAIGQPRSAILLCGYQDEESQGFMLRRLSREEGEPAPVVTFGGQEVEVHCKVEQYSLSAHSDVEGIEALIDSVQPATVALVHGTPLRLGKLQSRLDARRHSIEGAADTLVVVAHAGEVIEAETPRRTRRSRAALPVGHIKPGQYVGKLLTGRIMHNEEGSWATPYLTAVLGGGAGSANGAGMAAIEVARTDTLLGEGHAPRADELRMVQTALSAGTDILWQPGTVGLQKTYTPIVPEAPYAVASRDVGVRIHESIARIAQSRPDPREKERVLALGIREHDLILAVQHYHDAPSVLLALVVTGDAPHGYRVGGARVPDGRVTYNQIVTRVAHWPVLSGVPGHLDIEDLRLLDALNRAIEMAIRDIVSPDRARLHGERHEAAAAEGVGAALRSIWARAQRGTLSPMAATLASLLLTSDSVTDGPGERTIRELVELLGSGQKTSEAAVSHYLKELEELGVLDVKPGDGVVRLDWAMPELVDLDLDTHGGAWLSSEGRAVLGRFGPKIARVVERALIETTASWHMLLPSGDKGAGSLPGQPRGSVRMLPAPKG